MIPGLHSTLYGTRGDWKPNPCRRVGKRDRGQVAVVDELADPLPLEGCGLRRLSGGADVSGDRRLSLPGPRVDVYHPTGVGDVAA